MTARGRRPWFCASIGVLGLVMTLGCVAGCGGSSEPGLPPDPDAGTLPEVDSGKPAVVDSGVEASSRDADSGQEDSGLLDASPNDAADPGDSGDAAPDAANDAGDGGATLPTLSIADAQAQEGSGNAVLTVTLSSASASTVTVGFSTADGTAVAGPDYTTVSGTLEFPPGTTTQSITVPLTSDTMDEADETLTVTLSNGVAATLGTSVATVTLIDDDDVPTLTARAGTVVEGSSGTSELSFTVDLSAASAKTVSVDFATVDGTATVASGDYSAILQSTLTFAPGEVSKSVTVQVTGDTVDEADETFEITLSNAVNAQFAVGRATGTIEDDDDPPQLSVAGVSLSEGDTGEKDATLTVSLSSASQKPITVDFATSDGSASGGADYRSANGTLTFAPGVLTQTIRVAVLGDSVTENDETFRVGLSNATNALVATASADVTIRNDDSGLPVLDVAQTVETSEGASGPRTLSFTVNLSASSGQTVTVDYNTADGTGLTSATSGGTAATGGRDYDALTGTLTFAPGERSKTIDVTVNGDLLDEDDESFTVTLSGATNATIGEGVGRGTIRNDDSVSILSVADPPATAEGSAGTRTVTFDVTLSAPSGKTVSVDVRTADGTATATGSAATGGSDYVALANPVTFPPGTTRVPVSVTVNGDLLNEADETFSFALSNPTNATLGQSQATGTIQNDDPLPSLTITGGSVTEGNTGTRALVFNVTLSVPSARAVTVNYATVAGTATEGTDYLQTSGTLTFPVGTTSNTITVQVAGDTNVELSEALTVGLSSPTNATLGTPSSATGTIVEDDGSRVTINDVTIDEGNSGTRSANLTVTLTPPATGPVTLDFATQNATAAAGLDYVATSGTLSFATGEFRKTISVRVTGDLLDEANETALVVLSNPTNAAISDGTGVLTIRDDDAAPTVSIGDRVAAEGTGNASTRFDFVVSLSSASGRVVTVNYATGNGAGTAGARAGTDYTATSGTVRFDPGETSKQVSVNVTADAVFEANETFTVTLSGVSNATYGRRIGTGTITNDDAAPTASIDDVSITEGNSGTRQLNFRVSLSAASGQVAQVDVQTVGVTATAGIDFISFAPATLTFQPGVTTITLTVLALGDIVRERDETFEVRLSNPVGATVAAGGVGVGTITNDD